MIYCNQRRIQVYPTVPISREEYLIVHPTYAKLTLQFDFNRMYWKSIMILQLLARQVHASFSRRLQPILKESFAQGSLLFLAMHRARK